jgi:hypothetical protein
MSGSGMEKDKFELMAEYKDNKSEELDEEKLQNLIQRIRETSTIIENPNLIVNFVNSILDDVDNGIFNAFKKA